MRALRLRTEAVSPVVGMALMIGVTVLLAGIVYLYSGGVAGDGVQEKGPEIGVRVDESNNKINVVTFEGTYDWDEFRILPSVDIGFRLSGTPFFTQAFDNVGYPLPSGPVEPGQYIEVCGLTQAENNVEVKLIHTESNTQAMQAARFQQIPLCIDASPDFDGDGFVNTDDNCWDVPNDQTDVDADGAGDACDGDRDGDGVANDSDLCNSPSSNWNWAGGPDYDEDGCEDGTAEETDDDNDAIANADDACPTSSPHSVPANTTANDQTDSDIDGDGCFNHEDTNVDEDTLPNCDPATGTIQDDDIDGDGELNADDPDIDGDGEANGADASPYGMQDDAGTPCPSPLPLPGPF